VHLVSFAQISCWISYLKSGMAGCFILGKARKRKRKETKLMKEYAKVHQKDQEVTESLPAAVESVQTSLHCTACFLFSVKL